MGVTTAVDYSTLKKGGFMRQKQKNNFSLRLRVVGGNLTAKQLAEGDVEPGVCGPRVRTITACQGQAICPSGCIDTYSLAKELDEIYFAKDFFLCFLSLRRSIQTGLK